MWQEHRNFDSASEGGHFVVGAKHAPRFDSSDQVSRRLLLQPEENFGQFLKAFFFSVKITLASNYVRKISQRTLNYRECAATPPAHFFDSWVPTQKVFNIKNYHYKKSYFYKTF